MNEEKKHRELKYRNWSVIFYGLKIIQTEHIQQKPKLPS